MMIVLHREKVLQFNPIQPARIFRSPQANYPFIRETLVTILHRKKDNDVRVSGHRYLFFGSLFFVLRLPLIRPSASNGTIARKIQDTLSIILSKSFQARLICSSVPNPFNRHGFPSPQANYPFIRGTVVTVLHRKMITMYASAYIIIIFRLSIFLYCVCHAFGVYFLVYSHFQVFNCSISGWAVRSRPIGVIETNPSLSAPKSVPLSSLPVGLSPPIQ
jgi:hypothetical protein